MQNCASPNASSSAQQQYSLTSLRRICSRKYNSNQLMSSSNGGYETDYFKKKKKDEQEQKMRLQHANPRGTSNDFCSMQSMPDYASEVESKIKSLAGNHMRISASHSQLLTLHSPHNGADAIYMMSPERTTNKQLTISSTPYMSPSFKNKRNTGSLCQQQLQEQERGVCVTSPKAGTSKTEYCGIQNSNLNQRKNYGQQQQQKKEYLQTAPDQMDVADIDEHDDFSIEHELLQSMNAAKTNQATLTRSHVSKVKTQLLSSYQQPYQTRNPYMGNEYAVKEKSHTEYPNSKSSLSNSQQFGNSPGGFRFGNQENSNSNNNRSQASREVGSIVTNNKGNLQQKEVVVVVADTAMESNIQKQKELVERQQQQILQYQQQLAQQTAQFQLFIQQQQLFSQQQFNQPQLNQFNSNLSLTNIPQYFPAVPAAAAAGAASQTAANGQFIYFPQRIQQQQQTQDQQMAFQNSINSMQNTQFPTNQSNNTMISAPQNMYLQPNNGFSLSSQNSGFGQNFNSQSALDFQIRMQQQQQQLQHQQQASMIPPIIINNNIQKDVLTSPGQMDVVAGSAIAAKSANGDQKMDMNNNYQIEFMNRTGGANASTTVSSSQINSNSQMNEAVFSSSSLAGIGIVKGGGASAVSASSSVGVNPEQQITSQVSKRIAFREPVNSSSIQGEEQSRKMQVKSPSTGRRKWDITSKTQSEVSDEETSTVSILGTSNGTARFQGVSAVAAAAQKVPKPILVKKPIRLDIFWDKDSKVETENKADGLFIQGQQAVGNAVVERANNKLDLQTHSPHSMGNYFNKNGQMDNIRNFGQNESNGDVNQLRGGITKIASPKGFAVHNPASLTASNKPFQFSANEYSKQSQFIKSIPIS